MRQAGKPRQTWHVECKQEMKMAKLEQRLTKDVLTVNEVYMMLELEPALARLKRFCNHDRGLSGGQQQPESQQGAQ